MRLVSILTTFVSFAVFGFMPLLTSVLAQFVPFLRQNSFTVSIALVGVTLFALGAAKTKITGRPWLSSGFETLGIAGITAAAA